MTVHMIERPQHFNVIVCENLVGDILSDLGAALMGGLGLAPSSETGIKHGMFQGSHGSAPSIAGKDQANPVACILSAARMLSWLGDMHNDSALQSAATRIEQATERVLAANTSLLILGAVRQALHAQPLFVILSHSTVETSGGNTTNRQPYRFQRINRSI